MPWYYRTSGGPQGPITEDELIAMLASGSLSSETPVREEGREEWRSASEFYELGAKSQPPLSDAHQALEASTTDHLASRALLEDMVASGAKTELILWGAFLYSVIAYGGLVWFLSKEAEQGPVAVNPSLVTVMIIAAIICSLLGLLYRQKRFSDRGLGEALQKITPTDVLPPRGKKSAKVSEALQARYAQLTPGDKRLYLLRYQLFTARIICLAFFEAVALFGTFLGLLSKDLSFTLPFVVVAIALLATIFPNTKGLMARAARRL